MSDLEIKSTGEIVGYASLFGGPADAVGDIVAAGAYADSLARGMPLMLREHKGQPVGRWESVVEDALGLKAVGVVTDAAALADLRAGRIGGLSIGFRALKSTKNAAGARVLERVALAEISIVRRPASSRARVLSVKSIKEPPMSEFHHAAADNQTATPAEEAKSSAAVAAAVAAALKPFADRLARIEAAQRRPGILPPAEAKSDEATFEAKAFNDYLRFGVPRMGGDEAKALRMGDDTAGGYLATPEFQATVDKNVVLFSPIRGLATVGRTSASEVRVPKRTGRPTAAWVDEIEDRPETASAYGQATYPTKEIAGYIDVSIQLLEDAAVDIAAEIAGDVAEELGRKEGEAFVTGTGVGRPGGFMQDAAVGFTVSGHASTLTADGLIDLFHALPSPYRSNGTWALNSDSIAAIRKLKTTTGEYLLSMAGLANSPVTTLLGRPVVEAVDMPGIEAGAFPVAFGDFRQAYRIFDRVGLSILRDDLTQRTAGKVRFHFRKRLAAGVRKAEAIRKLKIAAA